MSNCHENEVNTLTKVEWQSLKKSTNLHSSLDYTQT